MKGTLVSLLFDKCIKAYEGGNFALMAEILKEISILKLQPNARTLFDRLSTLAIQKRNIHISEKVISSIELADISAIILIGESNFKALAKTIESIERIREKGITVHCLLLECLPFGTDILTLSEKEIPQFPIFLKNKLIDSSIDYVLDYGYTNKTLRRAIRCAGGRYISFLREGDELFTLDEVNIDIPRDYDLLIASPNASQLSLDRLLKISNDYYGLVPLAALLSTCVIYDGSLLIDRDYFDDMLGMVKYDSENSFFGYINEIISVELTKEPARVKFITNFGCTPSSENFKEHVQRIKSYTLYCIESRREDSSRALENNSEKLISELLKVSRDVFTKNSIHENLINLEDGLSLVQQGKLPETFKKIIRWYAQELRELTLVEKPAEISQLSIKKNVDAIPVLSFVSSIFNGQKLLHSYLTDITRQTVFYQSELIVVSPKPNLIQDLLVKIFEYANQRIKLVQLNQDPGIYECWNIGIKASQAEFITNANLDDRRSINHAEKLLDSLRYTGADVASSAVCITDNITQISEFDGDLQSLQKSCNLEIWYSDLNVTIEEKFLADFFLWGNNDEIVQCMNFPHCMPVWRRQIHNIIGFFDEESNGTYADFALWLKAADINLKFIHLSEPCGLYYVDSNSHNRINSNQKRWQSIVNRYYPKSITSLPDHVKNSDDNKAPEPSIKIINDVPKINFGTQILQDYGKHRSGWSYAVKGFESLHDPSSSIYCDTFIEKKFVWGADLGDGGSGPVIPYSHPWIGFIHVPPYVPGWFQAEQSNQRIFSRASWLKSIENCQGLFTLTEYHRKFLLKILRPKFPISTVYHPTEFPDLKFDFDKYRSNDKKRIIQIGWWLRKLYAIKNLDTPNHIPTLLGRNEWTKSLMIFSEVKVVNPNKGSDVEIIEFLDNDAYDSLLSENLVFIDFYDTSANNAVIECIARATPILICRHPAVIEYLGAEYPLYYDAYEDIPLILNDFGKIQRAHLYLKNPEFQHKLSIDNFVQTFIKSEVICNIHKG